MRDFFRCTLGRGLALLALPLALAGAVRADEVTDWHEHMLVAFTKGGGNSQIRSRNAALVSAAVFDAVNGIERRYAPIHVPAAAPRGASKRAAAVQAAYAILLSKFPAQADELVAKRAASLAAIADGGESMGRGLAWGQFVADEILRWRNTDGFTPAPPLFRDSKLVFGARLAELARRAAIRHHDPGDPVATPFVLPDRWQSAVSHDFTRPS